MTTQSAELQIPNAGAGTWTYEIQNTGTQSTQYSLSVTTAGTGIVSGMVADAQTGRGLDSITVASSGGLSTVTTDGYYALLHPAGMFSLQTRSGSYVTASRSVTAASC